MDSGVMTMKDLAIVALMNGGTLSGANLSGADLRWADWRGADLRGVDLRWTDLRASILTGSDMRGASLSWADLSGAILIGADLSGASLRWASLIRADLSGAKGFHLLPVQDVRGFTFPHAIQTDAGWRVRVGCRDFSIPEALAHWGSPDYPDAKRGAMYVHAIQWLMAEIAQTERN